MTHVALPLPLSDLPENGANAPRITLATATEFLEPGGEPESQQALVEGLLLAGSDTRWQGRPKVGKSHTLLQLAFDAACGLPVFGRFRTPRPLRVVYVELEEPKVVTQGRLELILQAHGGDGPEPENLRFLSREDVRRLRLLSRELLGSRICEFSKVLHDCGAELIILIALRKFIAPGDNLKNQEVAEQFNAALEALQAETGAAIATAHHERKAPGKTVEMQGFGSTLLAAPADAIFELERAADGLRKVSVEARYEVPERFFLKLATKGDGQVIEFAETPTDPREEKFGVLSALVRSGESVRSAARDAGLPYETARRALNRR